MGGLHDAAFFLVLTVVFIAAAFLSVQITSKEYPESFVMRYLPVCLPLLITLAVWAACMVISKGFYGHHVFGVMALVEIAFVPVTFFTSFIGKTEFILYIPLIYHLAFLLFFTLKECKTKVKPLPSKKLIYTCSSLVLAFSITGSAVAFSRSKTVLPKDYGFSYGGGYASVDIYRYNVKNSDNILAVLDSPSNFIISNKNKMPVLDGAEAAYPVYSAYANACYEGIADTHSTFTDNHSEEEKPAARKEDYSLSDEKITFTNTND
jgi:phosphate transport system substrate-binding protein